MTKQSFFQAQSQCDDANGSSEDDESAYEAGLSSVGSSFIDDDSSIGDSSSSDSDSSTISVVDDASAIRSIIAAAFPSAPLSASSNPVPVGASPAAAASSAAFIAKKSNPITPMKLPPRAKPLSPAAAAKKALEAKIPGDISFPIHCWSLTVTKTKDDVSVALLHVFASFIETHCIRGMLTQC